MMTNVLGRKALIDLIIVKETIKADYDEASRDIAGSHLYDFIEKCFRNYQEANGINNTSGVELDMLYRGTLRLEAPICTEFEEVLSKVANWEWASRLSFRYIVGKDDLIKCTDIAIEYLSKLLDFDFSSVNYDINYSK